MFEGIDKKELFIAGGIALVVFTLLLRKKSNTVTTSTGSFTPADTSGHNDTIFIPTNTYDIKEVQGNETITNTDNRTTNANTQTATGGGIISQPVPVTLPVVHLPNENTPIHVTPSPAPKPVVTQPTYTTYTIKKGDTLWKISGGNQSKITAIQKLNGISNPNKIMAGTTIKIPK